MKQLVRCGDCLKSITKTTSRTYSGFCFKCAEARIMQGSYVCVR